MALLIGKTLIFTKSILAKYLPSTSSLTESEKYKMFRNISKLKSKRSSSFAFCLILTKENQL